MRNRPVVSKRASPSPSASTVISSGTVLATGTSGAALAKDSSVDGLEGLLTAANALLTTQASYLDGLETLIAGTNTKLDTLIAAIGDPADAAWDGVTASASLIAIMKAVWAKLP